MPSGRENRTLYIGPVANVESINSSTLYKGGELGSRFLSTTNKEYQLVQLDSGATSANTVGVVAAGQLAFWKSKSSYIVTNDLRLAVGASGGCRNEVAGVFTVAATAGNFTAVQTKGNNAAVALKSASPNVGDWVVGDNTASKAQADIVAIGTAPTVQPIGKAAAAGTSVTAIAVDLDIPDIP